MIKWEEPGEETRGRKGGTGRWQKVADMLRENPGEWALVAENEWQAGAMAALKKYGCEVTCRGVSHGKAEKIYARYVEEGF